MRGTKSIANAVTPALASESIMARCHVEHRASPRVRTRFASSRFHRLTVCQRGAADRRIGRFRTPNLRVSHPLHRRSSQGILHGIRHSLCTTHIMPSRRQLGHQIWGCRDTVFTGRVFTIDAYFQGVCGLSGNGARNSEYYGNRYA